jgi:hypothetical protein
MWKVTAGTKESEKLRLPTQSVARIKPDVVMSKSYTLPEIKASSLQNFMLMIPR